MRHDWVFDVLSDLHAYACRNELPGLAKQVEAALSEAQREIHGAAADCLLREGIILRGRAN